jgi:hypothetical protein
MQSNQILRVTAVALTLGFGGALAAQPKLNFRDNNISLSPARTSPSGPGLSLVANSMNAKTPKGYTTRSGLETTRSALGMRSVPNRGKENSAAPHGLIPNGSKGLADLAPGLPTATSPAVRRMVAAGNGRDHVKAFSKPSDQ